MKLLDNQRRKYDQFSRKKTNDRCQPRDDPNVETFDFKGPIITIIHVVKENTLEINEKVEILHREIQTTKKFQLEILELKNTVSENF